MNAIMRNIKYVQPKKIMNTYNHKHNPVIC